jgi:CRISPR-associated protein Csd2
VKFLDNHKLHLDIGKRHDFLWFFDVTNGNPNGDPDNENRPRQDIRTQHGYVSDVCLKRKLRNYAQTVGKANLFVKEKSLLNEKIEEARVANGIELPKKGKRVQDPGDVETMRDWMCRQYWDIACFGGVLSTGANAGQVRGAIQIGLATSLHEISVQSFSITRCAV